MFMCVDKELGMVEMQDWSCRDLGVEVLDLHALMQPPGRQL